MANSVPSAKAPMVDETASATPVWYRFFAESVPPQGSLVLWQGNQALPAGYTTIGSLAVDGWDAPLLILTKGTGAPT